MRPMVGAPDLVVRHAVVDVVAAGVVHGDALSVTGRRPTRLCPWTMPSRTLHSTTLSSQYQRTDPSTGVFAPIA
jgi:hypothetical protein